MSKAAVELSSAEERRAAIALLDEPNAWTPQEKKPAERRKRKQAAYIARQNGEPTSGVMPQLDITDRVMTVEEYAEFTRVSTTHVYNLCRGGGIAGAVKFGGAWRIIVKGARDYDVCAALERLNDTLAAVLGKAGK